MAGAHDRIVVQNDPVNWVDPYGLFPNGFFKDPRVPKNFKNLPTETQVAIINAYQKELTNKDTSHILNVFQPTEYSEIATSSNWIDNPAHQGAILSSIIVGAKAGADTKNPYAGIIVGGASLGGSCIGCHWAHEIIYEGADDQIKPCSK